MSILSKFFSRKTAKSTGLDAIVINQVKSFKLEFPDKNPTMTHNGADLMKCSTNCHVIVNGISMNITSDFHIETPDGDGFTLEEVAYVDYFLPSRAAFADGTPTLVTFSNMAILELITFIKAQLVYERYEVVEEGDVYLCI